MPAMVKAQHVYHGLYVELKRKTGGKVSIDQLWWLERLELQGYYTTVCRGYDETVAVILGYLKGEIKA